MNTLIRPVSEPDWEPIAAIFNYFVTESFAAYPDQPVDAAFFRDRHAAHPMFPFVVAEIEGEVVGFAYLSSFHPVPTMRQTANLTYFLHPEFTGRGIGAAFLEHLLEAGKTLGITNFMAHISSLNPGSIRFHLAHGFTKCGSFINVGVKNGRSFDMVWLQKEQG
ncbi:MAG: N-acetyltransferase family protein [Actinomycetia bacterium]|nr:N-acetyltransferase family protein [Actinomycetes bacterium]